MTAPVEEVASNGNVAVIESTTSIASFIDVTVVCFVLLLSAESDINIKSALTGVALVCYVFIIDIISFLV